MKAPLEFVEIPIRLLFLFSVLSFVGCQSSSSPVEQDRIVSAEPTAPDTSRLATIRRQWESGNVEQKAGELWREVQNHYATISSYSDKAQVQLSYELLSNMIYESMPVSIAFRRPAGIVKSELTEASGTPTASASWHGQVFRAQLYGDSEHVAVTINEASTNHLDRQLKLISKPRHLMLIPTEDPVAKIYLSGATDIPLSERALNQLVLFAPQLEWLDPKGWVGEIERGTSPDGRQDRSSQGQEPTAIDDLGLAPTSNLLFRGLAIHNEHVCVKLGQPFRGFETEFWIDVDNKLIRKLVFDHSLLDATLSNTSEVRRLQIQIDFGEILVGEQAQSPKSLTEFPTDRTVRHFVKIPEAFPSPWIGQHSPAVTVTSHIGTAIRLPSKTLATVAVFLSQLDADAEWWQTLKQLAKVDKNNSLQVVLILDGIATGTVVTPVANRSVAVSEPQLVPAGAEAWRIMGLNQGRWVVVWDSQGTVQYIGAADRDGIIATVGTIFGRLANGDSIGAEMIAEYQSFYSEYLKQLEAQQVTAVPALVGGSRP
ncbi:MAG: hypothetical protein JNL67_15850 [Planctomycetaceae bacterium]|nr:hypothetical protein [Planctomycetaceae bacterium]